MIVFKLLTLIICQSSLSLAAVRNPEDSDESTCSHPECYTYAARLAAGVDWSEDPCNDFFQFACGRWVREADNPNLNIVMDDLFMQQSQLNTRVKEILFSPVPQNDTALQKAQNMFLSCIRDEDNILGNVNELRKIVTNYGGWKLGTQNNVVKQDVIALITNIASQTDIKIPFSLQVLGLLADNTVNIVVLSNPTNADTLMSLYPGLTTRDIAILAIQVFNITDATKALQDAADVLQFDSVLNNMIANTVGELGLAVSNYDAVPGVDWISMMNSIFKGIKTYQPGSTSQSDVIRLLSSGFYKQFFSYIEDQKNASTVYNYLMLYHTIKSIRNIGDTLPSPLREIGSFRLFSKNSRQDDCLAPTMNCFDIAIARRYGELYQDVDKEVTLIKELTDNILDAFGQRLSQLDWLDEPSKAKAEEKLKFIKTHYVYPDWATDLNTVNDFYKDVNNVGTLIGSISECVHFSYRQSLKKIMKTPSEPLKWDSSPLMVNAFYNPVKNDILILEAILDKQIFNSHRLRIMNYGGLGYVLGHEITHGFDNIGVQYNEKGNYGPWLSSASQQNFNQRAQCLINQYWNYILTNKDLPGPTTKFQVNGNFTLRENIADDGGLKVSYLAYKNWVANNPPETIPEVLQKDFTTEQTFFLSFARTWCVKYEYGVQVANLNDTHSPDKFRINGPLSNFEEFGKAFDCPEGSPMVRGKDACHVW